MLKSKYIIIFVTLLSQAIFASEKESPIIDCAGTAKEAQLSIPNQDVSKWAKVVCTRYGHIIAPADGFAWTTYMTLVPIVLPAQKIENNKNPKEIGNSAFFTSITAKKLNKEEAKSVAAKAAIGDPYPQEPLPDIYLLSATSNTNEHQKIYFLQHQGRLSGAIPYPDWMENENKRELMPFFIYDGRNSLPRKAVENPPPLKPSEYNRFVENIARKNGCDHILDMEVEYRNPGKIIYSVACETKNLLFECKFEGNPSCYLM